MKIYNIPRENRQRSLPADATLGVGDKSAHDCDSVHCHIDYVENIENCKSLLRILDYRRGTGKQLSELNSQFVVAWFTMIFRGLCWYQLHYMVPGTVVGGQYWNSQRSVHTT